MSPPAVCALSVDLEEYFHVSNFASLIDSARWSSMPSRIEHETGRLLDLFDTLSCRATFFALGWVAERHPRLLAEIARRGHEVASHGYGHGLVHELGTAGFRADLRKARGLIEDATGSAVLGYRAPSYSITRRSLWALTILAEEGYRYDSSIFPIHHPSYGIPQFASELVRIDLGEGLFIVEFPLTATRVGWWNLPVAGGAYLRLLPARVFRWGFRRAARSDGPAVLYLHPWELDPDQPRLRVGWKTRLRHYHNLGRVEDRVRRLLSEMAFDTMVGVIEFWEVAGRVPTRKLDECIRQPVHVSAPAQRAVEQENRG